MDEIREFLINQFQGADEATKERIKILLKKEVVTLCKCPKCGENFEPEEGFKSGLIMYPMERETILMPTTDNWYPNFEGNKVELSKMPMRDGGYRVCVWGNDDFGMEFDTPHSKVAEDLFEKLKGEKDITTQMLTDLKFVQA